MDTNTNYGMYNSQTPYDLGKSTYYFFVTLIRFKISDGRESNWHLRDFVTREIKRRSKRAP